MYAMKTGGAVNGPVQEREVSSRHEFWQTIHSTQKPVVFRGTNWPWEVLPPGLGRGYALLDHATLEGEFYQSTASRAVAE